MHKQKNHYNTEYKSLTTSHGRTTWYEHISSLLSLLVIDCMSFLRMQESYSSQEAGSFFIYFSYEITSHTHLDRFPCISDNRPFCSDEVFTRKEVRMLYPREIQKDRKILQEICGYKILQKEIADSVHSHSKNSIKCLKYFSTSNLRTLHNTDPYSLQISLSASIGENRQTKTPLYVLLRVSPRLLSTPHFGDLYGTSISEKYKNQNFLIASFILIK